MLDEYSSVKIRKQFIILNGYIRIWKSEMSRRVPDKKRCEIFIPKNQIAVMLQKMVNKKVVYDPITGEIR